MYRYPASLHFLFSLRAGACLTPPRGLRRLTLPHDAGSASPEFRFSHICISPSDRFSHSYFRIASHILTAGHDAISQKYLCCYA